MILLDTNICIYIINERPPAVLDHFNRYALGEIGISTVVAAELTYGVVKSRSERNRNALEMFLAPLEVLPVTEDMIWHYGEICSQLESDGLIIGAMDLLIAAHALSLNRPLVTNNQQEFSRVQGLQLENWVSD